MNSKSFNAFVDLAYSVRDFDLFEDFIYAITSDKDKENIPKRMEIIQKLLDGENHHKIAKELGVGVATVTKGSKLLAEGRFKLFNKQAKKTSSSQPEKGYFGKYGGRYVPEMLQGELARLANAYDELKEDREFLDELNKLQTEYNNRPTPLVYAKNLTKKLDGARIYLKNEGMNHTGAHKINHCLGQALVAKKMGKKRLIAETGAGQHGLATATVAAKFGMKCTVYMGEIDIKRQQPNVVLMELLGAEVVPIKYGSKTLKDAVSGAIRDWLANSDDTHYVIGSCLGPDPYPRMNRDFQSIIGREVKSQLGKNPDMIIACVGGGSNALGVFTEFLGDSDIKLIGVEAGGKSKKTGQHAARFPGAKIGIMEGYKSYFLQDKDGNSALTHSVSAGLDYIGIGPELAELYDKKRVEFVRATDKEALKATEVLAKSEGIIPALESAHAVSEAMKRAKKMNPKQTIVVNISGRGDKDLFTIAKNFAPEKFKSFLKRELESYA
ncbi:MAG TPA: tryptophan synthase subunit beta [Candidatus Saccharimonadales bacterium]|nr:tryptophan synthase subunit beta [Candidatus Saccharimonadales bacterium]